VELAVEHDELADVGHILDPGLELGQPVQLILAQPGDALNERERLQAFPHLIQNLDIVHPELGHPGAPVGLVVGQPLGLQDPQRLADRKSAGPQPLGHLCLPDPLAGDDLPVEYRVPQVGGDTFAGRFRIRHGGSPPVRSNALPFG
jgi:hypothetical protein